MVARIHSNNSIKVSIVAIVIALFVNSIGYATGGQSNAEPRREELLNGLRVLILSQPANPGVTISLRLHSGAAFDLAGKTGTMALLSDQLFPDPETHDFFVEELGGSLTVTPDYDAINIRMTGRASEFERMLELLRTALISTPITNENVARLRNARIKMIREMSIAPAFLADRAIAKRLYGEYPYGRPIMGTTDTLARIDRADLLLARDRFLTPDNATLVVIGGVPEARALRALRQILGAWRKSDKLVPATFRMSDPPDVPTLIMDIPGAEGVEVRLATRSTPRADKDYLVSALLTLLARDRWQAGAPELNRSAFFVRNESLRLSGMFVMGASVRTAEAAKVLETARGTLRALVESQPSAAELDRVRNELLALLDKGSNESAMISRMWLDAESYKLGSSEDQIRSLNKVTPADIQRVATRLFRDAQFAIVAVGSEAQVRADLERAGKVEVIGGRVETKSPGATTPATSP